MIKMITMFFNGREARVPEGISVKDAAKSAGIDVPGLCYHPLLEGSGSKCRLCMVEIEGKPGLVPACELKTFEGLHVRTQSVEIMEARRANMQLLLASHPKGCLTCRKSEACKLLGTARLLGITENPLDAFKPDEAPVSIIDDSSPAIVRDPSKCIGCELCVAACEFQTVRALGVFGRGSEKRVGPPPGQSLANTQCVNCGLCTHVCPVGAILEKSSIAEVQHALDDKNKFVVVQVAPAVRVGLAEAFGLPAGTLVIGKIYAALREMGFNFIGDTNFTADLTIMEEGSELIKRVTEGGKLPLITSCCPGWIKFAEEFYPDTLAHLSTCKSPQQMFGALAKTYLAQKLGKDPASIYTVSIMPCTAKKFEAEREEMRSSGFKDVDAVLTTREFAEMIKSAGIDFSSLAETQADSIMGDYTGAATIFGATGGVAEAAIRTVYAILTGRELEGVDYTPVRGMNGVKAATVKIGDLEARVAVAHGLANARPLLDELRAGKSPYQFIEIMACPGGCVGGGGQPFGFDMRVRAMRAEGLYKEDKNLPKRQSHTNPEVKKLYEEFLKHPLGEKSHHLLHTGYTDRSKR
jgi:NADH-quinone oxidoreductase subunit G